MLKNKLELREGVGVYTPAGQQVGKINRFVLDPATNEVTHIVVQKGWLLPEDKVVPLEMVSSATDDQVTLSKEAGSFDDLPPFEERHFVRTTEADLDAEQSSNFQVAPAYYWYPPQGYMGYPGYGLSFYPWPPVETKRNVPEQSVSLNEGANVISSDGKHVGDVERLFIDPDSNQATQFVITHGLLFKDRKLIPTQWVKSVAENEVRLVVTAHLLETLPEYVA